MNIFFFVSGTVKGMCIAGIQGDSSWDTLKCFINCQGAEARSWYFFSYSGGANLPYNKQTSYTCQFHNFVQTYNYSFPAVKLHLIVWCFTLAGIRGRGVFWGFSNAAPTDKSATEIMRALKLHNAFTVYEKAAKLLIVVNIWIMCAPSFAETVHMMFFVPWIHQVHTLEHCATMNHLNIFWPVR